MRKIRTDCIEPPPESNRTRPDYVPENSKREPVGRGDSFYSVASKYRLDPWWLVYYNFPAVGRKVTRRGARQTNWYLERYVGCRDVTRDRKNYVFSENQKREFIYVPKAKRDVPTPAPNPSLPFNAWFGFGIKSTTPAGNLEVITEERATAVLCSWDHFGNCFGLSTLGKRYGLRASLIPGSQTVAAYIATGLPMPRQLNGHELQGVDFTLAIGPVGKGLKEAAKLWKLRKAARFALNAAEWEKSREAFHQLLLNLDIDINSPTPKLHVLDLYSPGVEGSVYYLDSRAKVDWVHVNTKASAEVP